jgi:protease-4
MYDRLLRFKQEKNIKVVVSMGGYATSGGYYLACAADYIFAQPTSLTANIGVVYERFNFSGLMSKYGVEDTSITPAGSKYKNVESPFRPDTPETRAYLQTLVEAHYGRFKDIVKTGRGPKLKATIDVVADGRALTSDAAKQLGLIDDIGYLDAAYNKAASLAGLSKMHVVRYSPPKGLVEMLSSGDATSWLSFNASSQASPAIKLDRSLLDELTVPRMMSIYRGQ